MVDAVVAGAEAMAVGNEKKENEKAAKVVRGLIGWGPSELREAPEISNKE